MDSSQLRDAFLTNETPIAQHGLERLKVGMRFSFSLSLALAALRYFWWSLLYFTFHAHYGWDGYMGDDWVYMCFL